MSRILSLFSSTTLRKAYQLAWTRELRRAILKDQAERFVNGELEGK